MPSRLYRDSSPRASGAAAASTGFREARQSHRSTAPPWPRARRHQDQKKLQLWQKVAIGMTGARQVAGATGLEPATFGVTGRTKCNGINDSCKFSVAET